MGPDQRPSTLELDEQECPTLGMHPVKVGSGFVPALQPRLPTEYTHV